MKEPPAYPPSQQVSEAEGRLRLVIDAIPELVWSALPDGSIDFLNRRWQEYTGLSLEAGMGWGGTAAVHPDDLPSLMDEWRRSVATGQRFESEARLRRADGKYRWLLIRAVPLRDEKGNIVKWYGTSTDVEDRKQAEQIRAVQARHSALYGDVTASFCRRAPLNTTLNECVEAVVRQVDAAFARIWTLNQDRDMLELQASAGMYTHLDGAHNRIPVGKLKIGLIAEEKKPHLTNNVLNDPRVSDKAWARNEGIVSFAGYPLLVEDRLVGVLAMFARRTLAPDILDTLASVAYLIAQGIERYRAEEELRANEASFRLKAEQALEETGQRLAAQSKLLTELTATQARRSVDFDERLRIILQSSAHALGVERVSVWEFTENRSYIRCVDLFETAASRHTSGLVLPRVKYPKYFDALERERIIAAVDAHTDERTREFSSDYLVDNSIGAMLDVPLRQDDLTVGVLCAEHVGPLRIWSTDEQNFALSVANLVAAARADEDRRLALESLAASEELARLIVDTAHDAFVGMGGDGRIVIWNSRAEATFGWMREEAIGRPLVDTIIPVSLREAHLEGLRRFNMTGEAPIAGRLLELTGLHRDGHEFPIEITVTRPITRGENRFFGAFLRDISRRRQHEKELQQAKDSAEAAARAKSEFLANMSHELRTPLNGVLGYAQLLRRDRSLPVSHQEAVDAITTSGGHLLHLINDVLDLSKIEAGMVELEPVATDLGRLVADVRLLIAESARSKGLQLETHLGDDVPRRVVLDDRHLRQILINLLGNAVKFTQEGSVALVIERVNGRLRFVVSDTGIGIDPGHLKEIFEAFRQAPAGAEGGGTGLGLTISQRLVGVMGGELRVDSDPGKGSHFWFDVPLIIEYTAKEDDSSRTERGAEEPDLRLAPGQEVRALVVDDHSINRRMMAGLLESVGVRTIAAADGAEGIEMAKQHRPDVVLMDLRMRGLDGIEATRRLRAEPTTAAIPVLAVTASPDERAREAASEAGCSDFLAKPIRPHALIEALEHCLGVRFEPVASTADESDRPVEDNSDLEMLEGFADRLRQAAMIGSVSDLHAIARELISGDARQSRIGHQLVRLTNNFEFEAIKRLASAKH